MKVLVAKPFELRVILFESSKPNIAEEKIRLSLLRIPGPKVWNILKMETGRFVSSDQI
jgi:hypothetical protein